MLNKEGLALLRAVIQRDASLMDAVKKGDCKKIADTVNTYMPSDMQITPVIVHEALIGVTGYAMPKHNAEVLRKRIDDIPYLHAARLNVQYRGMRGVAAMQTIANELNMSPNHEEQVTLEDVQAAMDLYDAPRPEIVVVGSAALEGTGELAQQ